MTQTSFSRRWRTLRWMALALPGLWACSSSQTGGPLPVPTATFTTTFAGKVNDNLDILFMIDNSSEMTSMQQKLAAQLPGFIQALQATPNGLPNLHIGVVSSDMGAPGDSTNQIGCTAAGDDGNFQYKPGVAGMCTATTLNQGDTFISDGDGQKNFTDPIDTVLQCIAQLGAEGCGFEHQLASIDRALGADGQGGPPATNANFLRKDAYLGIVILTNEDDCSAPSNTTIFSLNGGMQSITNPDGPLMNYRCYGGPRGAHLCKDPSTGQMIVPPLMPPSDATGSPPILNLTDCEDNETGASALTPVSQFISDIKKLKADPDHQIFVAAITAPAAPYGVVWLPPASPPAGTSSQVWPQVMHSCGPGGDGLNPMATQHPTDGSFGDPGVRITQFASAFANHVVASICDADYEPAVSAIATGLGGMIRPNCIHATIQQDSQGNPACAVTDHLTDASGTTRDLPVADCAENGNVAPCWTLLEDPTLCAAGDLALKVLQDQAGLNATSLSTTIECPLCVPGSNAPGCQPASP